ncbi:hypothetical protein ScalyP_jg5206 [Parmales sp. scaly parma]|nr:hypothetical protein ScalyP_jg5206 [Parmales sp. scaly parma]
MNLSEEEVITCCSVYHAISSKTNSAGPSPDLRVVIAFTLINKCRVEKAVKGYHKFVEKCIDLYNIDINLLGLSASEQQVTNIWKTQNLTKYFRSYRLCGLDKAGASIFWIASSVPIEKNEEKEAIHASILAFVAAHADLVTLRTGISFIIDVTGKPDRKVGNERKLQETWQAFPLRPRHFFISGATFFKRLVINALLKVASAFSNNKVLRRIRFAKVKEVEETIGADSMPQPFDEGKFTNYVKTRLLAFPGVQQLEEAVANSNN